jgi:hypothetical protein
MNMISRDQELIQTQVHTCEELSLKIATNFLNEVISLRKLDIGMK